MLRIRGKYYCNQILSKIPKVFNHPKSINHRNAVLLVIIPLLLLWVAFSLKHWSGPYWLASNSDPDYAYLLNSLNITQFKDVTYTDHPGTTLQALGSAVIITVHLFRQGTNLVLDVLSNPELYLNAISFLLVYLIVISVLLIGLFTFLLTKNLLYGITMQTTPFLSLTTLYVLNRVSPEPLILLVGLWYSFSIFYLFYKCEYKLRYIVFISAISGFLIATKINTIPLIILPLVFLPFKAKAQYLLVTLMTLVLFTLPAYKKYPSFIQWIYELFIHAGKYGTGVSTIVQPRLVLANFISILTSEYSLTIMVLGIIIILILTLKRKKVTKRYNYFVGSLIFIVAQIIIVSKHFSFHYLTPALTVLGMLIVFILIFLDSIPNIKYRIFKNIVVVIFLFFAIYNFKTILQKTRGFSDTYLETLRIETILESNYSDYVKVP